MILNRWTMSLVPVLLLVFSHPARAQKKVAENTAETCQDGEDNDADGFVDCNDQDCSFMIFCAEKKEPAPAPAPPPPPPTAPENTVEACRDFKDNDTDGFIDCQDQDCSIFAFCLQKGGAGTPGMMPGTGVKREPRESRGGIGIYPSLLVYGYEKLIYDAKGTSTDPKTDAKNEFAAGVGLFGEALVAPSVAIGGEIILAFPKVDEIKNVDIISGTVDWVSCTVCERDVHFSMMFRLKFPFRVSRWVGLYPVVTLGLSNLTHRREHVDAANFIGLGYTTGLGVEFYTPAIITPFLEMRYHGALGFRADMKESEKDAYEKQTSVYHSIALNLGIKIL
jgi:hypothetical protein